MLTAHTEKEALVNISIQQLIFLQFITTIRFLKKNVSSKWGLSYAAAALIREEFEVNNDWANMT